MCRKIQFDIRNEKIKKSKNSTEISECDIYFVGTEYSLHIYTGSKNPNDIRLRYKKTDTQMRTPKHMHWLLDLILKKEKYPQLTNEFVEMLIDKYSKITTLPTPGFDDYKDFCRKLLEENLRKYKSLSKAGEYQVEFLYLMITLLIAQEKTNYPSGGLFQEMLKSLQYEKVEVFKLLGSEWWK